jgi:hypothetical protein
MVRTNNNNKNNQRSDRNVSIASGKGGDRKVTVGNTDKSISLSERFAKINKEKQEKNQKEKQQKSTSKGAGAKKEIRSPGVKKQNKTKDGAAIKKGMVYMLVSLT